MLLDKINFFWKRDKDRSMGEGANWETLVMESRLSDRCAKEDWGIYQIVVLKFIEKNLLIHQKYWGCEFLPFIFMRLM